MGFPLAAVIARGTNSQAFAGISSNRPGTQSGPRWLRPNFFLHESGFAPSQNMLLDFLAATLAKTGACKIFDFISRVAFWQLYSGSF